MCRTLFFGVFGKIITVLFLWLPVQSLQAETIAVPLKVDFPLLRQLVVSQLFRGESASLQLLNDPNGCNEIVLSDPDFTEKNSHLRINSRLRAKLAVNTTDRCMPLLAWEGHIEIISDPFIKADHPYQIFLKVVDSQLIGQDNEPLTSGILWDKVKSRVHPVFDQLRLDLRPSVRELKHFLPMFLPRHSQGQLDKMLVSMQLEHMRVTVDGIKSELMFDVPALSGEQPSEDVLSRQEQSQWQQRWQSMDALLTYTIKHFAAATHLESLRLTLLDILLDARYRLQSALQEDRADDPVRRWFINSWAQLIPVVRQISAENPEYATLSLMTLLTATDALKALDKLGPSFGLDISINGLRRLARMLDEYSDVDPLNYDEMIDPELQRLFQLRLNPVNDIQSGPIFNFWPIRSAIAADMRQLNNWVPDSHELNDYLARVRQLLVHSARQTIEKSKLTPQQQSVFKKLILATAWQESCWRQYIVKKKKIVPLQSSSGDTGIMQINETVWRGFVDLHKLRWDIAYNVSSGSGILLNYMTRYAIANGEHKRHGGIDNLARATYSAYNGGPGKVSRYRNKNVVKAHRKIDVAFHDKYLKIKAGEEVGVAYCLGGKGIKKANFQESEKTFDPIVKPRSRPGIATQQLDIQDDVWIKRQAENDFTLQLAVFSSYQSAEHFIHQQDIGGNYAIYRKRRNNKLLYAVIYGRFATRQLAENQGSRFKAIKPWVRQFKAIRERMRS